MTTAHATRSTSTSTASRRRPRSRPAVRPGLAAAAAAVLVAVVGCGGGDDGPDPLAPTDDGSSVASSPSSSPSPSPSATVSPSQAPDLVEPADWKDNLDTADYSAAIGAMRNRSRWLDVSADIYREGQATDEANDTLREYLFHWQREQITLKESFEEGGVRIIRNPEVVWTYPIAVDIDEDGLGSVTLLECADYTNSLATQNGKELPKSKPDHLVTPLKIRMVKPAPNYNWLQEKITLKDAKSCG